jgi:sugar O-acyltransferase (sialic acid O-acetyltransferase NeuD family)
MGMRLVIYGAGGFGREVVTAARGHDIAFLSDTTIESFAAVPVISHAELTDQDEIVIAISDANVRKRLARRIGRVGSVFAPTAVIGNSVQIGEGAIFCDFTMVTASAKIGRHFHCNIYSYVAHDCVIDDFVTFAPRVCCNGNVHIKDGAYIGTGAVIKQGTPDHPIIIGEDAVIGCGAVITKSVPAGAVMIGNPARPLIRAVAA